MSHLLAASLCALISLNIFAHETTYNYKCFSYYWNGDDQQKGTMNLSVSEQSASANIVEELWDENLGGALNPNYRSRGSIEYAKFGQELIVEKVLIKGGKKLRDGSMGGFARVEGVAEGGFYQYKFVCKHL